ncbi:MAG TPA: ribonuclease D [Stellaceae bacterium]|nr:ribonuclease D [Stellaceae bacterium]
MTLISDTSTLAAFCDAQAKAEFITVDTEFLREKTYWPMLCLVQIAGPEKAAAIDPLAPGIDLAPLYALLADRSILKVFHAARQDIEIFFNLTGAVPNPLFDTQIAAMVCGFGDQVSYETLATKYAQAQIDKSSRFTDWSQRPLTERQLHYALADVVPLRTVYQKLASILAKNGRFAWLEEELAILTDPATYNQDPAEAWRRLRVRSNNRRLLALVRDLATWREQAARQHNLPRARVMRDEMILEIAAHAPRSTEELARTRGLGKGFADSKFGVEILAVIERTLAEPLASYPAPMPRSDPSPGIAPLIELLRVLLKQRCEEHEVAPKLIADSDDLEMIATDDAAPVRALSGWRADMFGKDAIDLKHGRLALTAAGNRIKLVRL